MNAYGPMAEEDQQAQQLQEDRDQPRFLAILRANWLKVTFVAVSLVVCTSIWALGGCFASTDNDDLIPDENRKPIGMLRDVMAILRCIGETILLVMIPP
ncbi:unnamed protein product [Phytophthora fragariaefolia]|uniref:Unnamed protein product n=1 Tax=Phytophthora fragariaefolia TaxID=1490495 RepID=A0A9W6YNI0_9STRA|nr:unnamed protein product [Phytophthora fragariaefolia]